MSRLGNEKLQSRWRVRYSAGEPLAVVQVRNLQSVIQAGQDAWGREGKSQPVIISAEVFLARDFGTAASADEVSSDTVHYGLLSKAILSSLELLGKYHKVVETFQTSHPESATIRMQTTLHGILSTVWRSLTGVFIGITDGTLPKPKADSFLDIAKIRFLEVKVLLPKASLLGDGVWIAGSAIFGTEGATAEMHNISQGISGLRIPTLIGINDNERLAKQVVVVSVELDKYNSYSDEYAKLESLIVKSTENSSYGTLEALGNKVIDDIAARFLPATLPTGSLATGCLVKVSLEKPTAIPLAEAARVEVSRSWISRPLRDDEVSKMV